MRAGGIIGHDRAGDEIWPGRLDPFIDVLAIIAVRPTIEAAVPNGSHIVGDQIASGLVTLVDCRPKRSGHRFPGESIGVAQTRRKNALGTGLPVDLPDRGAPFLGGNAIFDGPSI